MERRIRWRDVEMEVRCVNMKFSLYRKEGGNMADAVTIFKCLWRTLDQTYDDWLHQKITS